MAEKIKESEAVKALKMLPPSQTIRITGAREHNLKDVDLVMTVCYFNLLNPFSDLCSYGGVNL